MQHMSVTIEDKNWVKILMKGSLCPRGVVGSTREFKYEGLEDIIITPPTVQPKGGGVTKLPSVLDSHGAC